MHRVEIKRAYQEQHKKRGEDALQQSRAQVDGKADRSGVARRQVEQPLDVVPEQGMVEAAK